MYIMCTLKLAILHAQCKFDFTALFDREDSVNVSNITQSSCQVNFNTINNHLTTSIQLVMSTSQASTTVTFITTINTATFSISSRADSAPLVIIVVSITSGIIGVCIVFICIIGLILKKKHKQNSVKRGVFTFQSLTSTLRRYSCVYILIK